MSHSAWDRVNTERAYLLRLADVIEHGGEVGPHWIACLQKLYWDLEAVEKERQALEKGVLTAAHQVVAVWTARQEGRSSSESMRSALNTLVYDWRAYEAVEDRDV